jgi:hypothetical protein
VPLSVPQAGEHEVFATDKFQLTPWLPEAPETDAVKVTGAPPIAMVAKLPLTWTTIPEGDVEADEELHPEHQKKIERHSSATRERFIDPSDRKDFSKCRLRDSE